jgi:hypothetical protein
MTKIFGFLKKKMRSSSERIFFWGTRDIPKNFIVDNPFSKVNLDERHKMAA